MNKIHKGDEVVVIAGADKGRRAKVLARHGDEHVLVEGVNLVKRHTRPNPMQNQPGGVVSKEMPIHQSNVAIFNPASGKADRVGVRLLSDGNKVRVFRSSGEEIKV
ncbi:MAG: 50S ribosomal protein L24 [Betaproteobacteria bacterium]|jgi:large subunit ribosomal protein L24|uniref:Large ribosomal subunit protein uL24 n=1 Tax=Thiomonas delicata TaxID=364030 RepID=A0A238CZT6_THIDL|nr:MULTISPECIES: 50S ribosomal protein L24 [Thiomonas]MDE2130093.1 50S ribosomal protein L24 [Betaproteobacteria bacterium]OZB45063.1 MAG: 50S ribosomal protein L24 [Thiomonas sp. 15-66-11]SBP86513.1 50S ribosomal subunit protein L24 [Thiomonas delicata]